MQIETRRIFRIFLILVIGWIVYRNRLIIAEVINIFLLTALFSTLLFPICRICERKGLSGTSAAVVSLLMLVAVILLFAWMLIPYIVNQSISLIRRITPSLFDLFTETTQFANASGLSILDDIGLSGMIASHLSQFASALANFGSETISQIGTLCISLVVTYYVLKEHRRFGSRMLLVVPSLWRKTFLSALHACKDSLMSYLNAMTKTSLFVAGITFVTLMLLGIPNAFFLSVLMGIFELLPYVGPVIASAVIVLNCLPLGMNTILAVLASLILIQQIEGSFVSPHVTAASTSLHPLAALGSVLIFGRLYGIKGVFLAIPIVVIARSIICSIRQAHILMKAQEKIETCR